ncbi:hypothetical protein DRE_03981 [Drechslerella stenobrocha 248]|uniref:Kelch repeat-containing protein n=1 Tax=Drechslerella stenobrocha 248 TaxID=1043628 RepID=W7HRQ8_9PEZI|nr:hypothetical protein DRE_03981 [Drechslerella stenobrocha 248]
MSATGRLADPVRDTCSLTGHSGIVVDDLLYIQGGRMIYDGYDGFAQNPYLRILNLTDTVSAQNVPQNIRTITDNSAPFNWNARIQNTRLPMFWLDEAGNKAYLAMGARLDIRNTSYIADSNFNPGRPGRMWTADLREGGILTNWVESDLRINGRNASLVGTQSNWFDRRSRKGYAWGGSYIDGSEFTEGVNQLITFDAVSGQWNNLTTPFTQSPSGFMQGIELDGRNILITGLGAPNGQEGVMDTMRVYDTRSNEWYSQRTNGPLPPNRFWTGCSTIVAAQDRSSYQIVWFGGANSTVTFGDVWALSIPSFTWTRLSQDITSNVAARPRYAPSCHLMKEHYMVVFGGNRVQNEYTFGFPNCDQGSRLAFFFDLNVLEWSSQVNSGPQDPYRVPQPVYEAIGGSAEGGATLTEPPGGFNQAGLATVFAAFPNQVRTDAPGTTTGPAVTSTSAAPSGSSASGGTIGGVIGGIAVLALIGVGIWFFMRRRRRQRPIDFLAPPPPPPPSGPPASEQDKGYIGYADVGNINGIRNGNANANANGNNFAELSGLQSHHVALRPELQGDSAVYNAELPGSTPDYTSGGTEVPGRGSTPLLPRQGPYEAPA